MKDIAVYGAGGLGREIACIIRMINEREPSWNFIGFFDDAPSYKGTKNEYGEIFGGYEILNQWEKPIDVVISVGSPSALRIISSRITNPLVEFPNIIAPSVSFLDENRVKMGKGNIFCTNCMISTNVEIGNFNIFNGYIPLGHDAKIGSFNVVMPSCNISGGVEIGNSNFFGVQSVVLQYQKIGNNVRVGANSVIMRNTKDGFLYLGNPAKKMEI